MAPENKKKYIERYNQENYERINFRLSKKEHIDLQALLNDLPALIGTTRNQLIINALYAESERYLPMLNRRKAYQQHIKALPAGSGKEYGSIYIGIAYANEAAEKSEIKHIAILDETGNLLENAAIKQFFAENPETAEPQEEDRAISSIKGLLNSSGSRIFFSEGDRDVLCAYGFTSAKAGIDHFVTSLINTDTGTANTFRKVCRRFSYKEPKDAIGTARIIKEIYNFKQP